MKKRLISVFLALNILFSAFVCSYFQSFNSFAAAALAGQVMQIVGYVASVTGLLNVITDGGVSSASGNVKDKMAEVVSRQLGSGIYVNSDGDYVFTESASQELYEAMLGNSSIDARVISNFGSSFAQNGLLFGYDQYHSNDLFAADDYLDGKSPSTFYSDCMMYLYRCTNGSTVYTYLHVYDMSNVAYVVCDSYDSNRIRYRFCDNTGRFIIVPYLSLNQTYSSSSGYLSVSRYKASDDVYLFDQRNNDYFTVTDTPKFNGDVDAFYNNFPLKASNGTGLFWSNRSVILAKSPSAGYALASQSGGHIVANNYTVIPKVSETIINNNDWNTIYNNYISDITNNYEEAYGPVSSENPIDMEKLRVYMKRYSSKIENAVEEGSEDIVEAIESQSDWLRRILNKLDILDDILEAIHNNNPDIEIPDIQDYTEILQNIKSLDESSLSELQKIYTALTQVNNKLNTLPYRSDVLEIKSGIDSVNTLLNQILEAIQALELPEYPSGTGTTTTDVNVNSLGNITCSMYPNVSGNNWQMGIADDPTFYYFFDVSNIDSVRLTTSGGTRTRIILTDYPVADFTEKINLGKAFTVSGSYAKNLNDSVDQYVINNTEKSKFLYVYMGNALGNVSVVTTKTVNTGGSSGGSGGNPSVPDLLPDLTNLPDANVLDYISDFDVLTAILADVMPFCFIHIGDVILGAFAVSPIDPVFELPLQANLSLVGISIDEKIVFDLTYLKGSTVYKIWISLVTILFMIFLAVLFVRLILVWLQIMF